MITNAQVQWVRSLADRKVRAHEGVFVAEGVRLALDLLGSRLRVARLYATAAALPALGGLVGQAGMLVEVGERDLERMSGQRSPQGVLALVELPDDDWRDLDPAASRILVLDEIQDPGNAGTMVRLADWFGLDAVVASPHTADLYQPKVVQASMGSLARVFCCHAPLDELFDSLPLGARLLGTTLDGDDLYQAELPRYGLLAIGNEARGLSAATLARLDARLRIPAYPPAFAEDAPAGADSRGVDSLNAAVAAAVCCAEWRRRWPT